MADLSVSRHNDPTEALDRLERRSMALAAMLDALQVAAQCEREPMADSTVPAVAAHAADLVAANLADVQELYEAWRTAAGLPELPPEVAPC